MPIILIGAAIGYLYSGGPAGAAYGVVVAGVLMFLVLLSAGD